MSRRFYIAGAIVMTASVIVLWTPARDRVLSTAASQLTGQSITIRGTKLEAFNAVSFKTLAFKSQNVSALETGGGRFAWNSSGVWCSVENVRANGQWLAGTGLGSWLKTGHGDQRWVIRRAVIRVAGSGNHRDWFIIKAVTPGGAFQGRVRTYRGQIIKAFIRGVVSRPLLASLPNDWLDASTQKNSALPVFRLMYSGRILTFLGPSRPLYRLEWQTFKGK